MKLKWEKHDNFILSQNIFENIGGMELWIRIRIIDHIIHGKIVQASLLPAQKWSGTFSSIKEAKTACTKLLNEMKEELSK